MQPDDGPVPNRRLIVTLAATYPDESVGYVTGLLRVPPDPLPTGLDIWETAPRARVNHVIQEMVDFMIVLYREEIGPAYGLQDFVFTVHDVADDAELIDLVGLRMLASQPGTDTHRPEVTGVGESYG